MKVYGYTKDKNVILAELSIERICAAGIDPWRVDLLDSQPVSLEVDGQVLYFRRLRDVAFAYQPQPADRQAMICRHDGEEGACLIGDCVEPVGSKSQCFQLTNVQISDRAFAEHLAEYLELAVTDVPPRPSKALTVNGDRLSLDLKHEELNQPWIHYTGEMNEETVAAVLLDERINWVFETLARFNPVVAGKAIVCSLTNQPLDEISVSIDRPGLKVVEELGAVLDETTRVYKLEREICVYIFRHRLFRLNFLVDALTLAFRPFGREELYSIDAAYSSQRNEVRGYRIGIYDLSQRQFRPLSHQTVSGMDDVDSRAAKLQSLGLTLITCEADKPSHFV